MFQPAAAKVFSLVPQETAPQIPQQWLCRDPQKENHLLMKLKVVLESCPEVSTLCQETHLLSHLTELEFITA
jgi:hypothetical protein